MTDDIIEVKSMVNHLHFGEGALRNAYDRGERGIDIYYQDVITITMKGQDAKIVKILNIYTSLDFHATILMGLYLEK
jgi:hypothetical protein